MKKVLTGIQATGNLTLGNYIGAMKPLINMQEEYEVYAFVANLHSIVLPIEPKKLKENTDLVLKIWKAAGLNTNKVKIWRQSDIPQHTELNWYLTTQTTVGELSRMNQFKDKAQNLKHKNGTETIPSGLLIYPVLQAADILLFNPDIVIVGDDQKQHIELTRNIAERFNNKFGTNFKIPEPLIQSVGYRIMALQDPSKKMSKSDVKLKNTIFLLDEESTIRKKIKSAITDNENKIYLDWVKKPGISNLLSIFAALSDISIEEAETIHIDMEYGEFKNSVANKIVEIIIPLQEKLSEIKKVNFLSTKQLSAEANITINNVKKKIGF